MRTCRENVIDKDDVRWGWFHLVLIHSVTGLQLGRCRSIIAFVRRGSALGLNDQFAAIDGIRVVDGDYHLGHAIVVFWIILGLGRRDGYECGRTKYGVIDGVTKSAGGRADSEVFVAPLGAALAVQGFFEVEDELIRLAVGEAPASRVFAEKQTFVIGGEVAVIGAGERVDFSEILGKGHSGCHRSV